MIFCFACFFDFNPKKTCFGLDGETRVSKDRIEAVDFEKKVIQWRVLEGPLKTQYNSVLKTMKVSPNHGGGPGSMVNWNLKYERINEKVAHPKRLLQFLVGVTIKKSTDTSYLRKRGTSAVYIVNAWHTRCFCGGVIVT